MVSVLSKLDYNYDERYFISGFVTAATVSSRRQQAGTLGKLLVSGGSVEHHARGFL